MLSTGKIIFGCRNFSLPQVPKRNRMGNRITSFVMRAFCSVKLSDTQTGLRAVPSLYFKEMLETKGDRYEYETNMLLTIKRENIPFAERCIDTVYIGGNETSHFKPFRDSLRIYAFLFKFAFSSFSSFLLDELAFFILFYLLAQPLGIFAKAVCTVSARIISSVYNFSLNKRVVFRYSGSLKGAVLRYYAAAAVILATSTLFLYLSGLVFKTTPIVTTINKAIIDACLFFASYKVQQQWVFKDNRRR